MNDPRKPNRKTEEMSKKAESMIDLDEIINVIKRNFPIRVFNEEFKKIVTQKAQAANEPLEVLKNKIKQEAETGNFDYWWNHSVAVRRDKAIHIAFLLGMDSKEAHDFLMLNCWHDGFYLRDYKDLIYAFYLDNNLPYADAIEMIKKYSHLDIPNPDVEMVVHKQASAKSDGAKRERITDKLRTQYEKNVSTKDELEMFLKENEECFGSFRRLAYEKFIKMYTLLKNEGEPYVPTDTEIYNRILMNIPPTKSGITNKILKRIAEHNLQRTGLSEIKKKSKTHVNRKHLIMIWMLTYGGNPGIENISEAYAEFKQCKNILDYELLNLCGMPKLDSRNPFDWLMINALYYCHFNDDDKDAVDRISKLMDALFNEARGDNEYAD